jgi:hypothetical protein
MTTGRKLQHSVWILALAAGCGNGTPAPPVGPVGTGGTIVPAGTIPPAGGGGTGGTADASLPAPSPDVAPAMADASAPDRRPPADLGGGAPSDGPVAADLLAACTPQMVNVTVQQPAAGGGAVFKGRVADPEATFKAIAIKVCTALYASPAGLNRRPAIGLTIADPGSGVAFTNPSSSRITFNAGYIAGLGGNATTQQYEIEGVIAHESVHIYQIFGGPTWLTEGIADAIRYRTGYFKLTNRRAGGNFNNSYQTTGFFLSWVDDKYPGFLVKLNLKNPKNEGSFMELTGKPVQMLWDEYQADIR